MKLIQLFVLVAVLAGCTQTVNTKVTAFNSQQSPQEGTVAIVAKDEEVGQSLEFQHYRERAALALAEHGFTAVAQSSDSQAQYQVTLGFLVQEVNSEDSGFRSGFVLRTSPWRSAGGDVIFMDDNDQRREYKRTLTFTIADASGQRLYEATASSVGRCDVMTVVFDEMLEAILQLYPQASGTVRNVKVKGDPRC